MDKKNLIRYLSTGVSPCLCPGGAQEVACLGTKDELVLYLRSRFGFVKLALQYGAALVPSFSFGLDGIYDCTVIKNKWVTFVGRKIGFMPIIFTGLWGIPFGPAKPSPLTLIVGKPIPVPKTEQPSSELVSKYLDMYVDAIVKLFETNKEKYGMANTKLKVI